MKYSETFKIQTVNRLKNGSLYRISKELGIPGSTLRTWRKQYGNIADLESVDSCPPQFDRPMRFMMVVETMSMTETELASYAEGKGLDPEQIKEWKMDFMAPESSKDAEIASLKKCLNEEKASHKKEVAQMNGVIAEMTAIAVMLKKAKAIWGVEEEE